MKYFLIIPFLFIFSVSNAQAADFGSDVLKKIKNKFVELTVYSDDSNIYTAPDPYLDRNGCRTIHVYGSIPDLPGVTFVVGPEKNIFDLSSTDEELIKFFDVCGSGGSATWWANAINAVGLGGTPYLKIDDVEDETIEYMKNNSINFHSPQLAHKNGMIILTYFGYSTLYPLILHAPYFFRVTFHNKKIQVEATPLFINKK